jgi:hypothetical protein
MLSSLILIQTITPIPHTIIRITRPNCPRRVWREDRFRGDSYDVRLQCTVGLSNLHADMRMTTSGKLRKLPTGLPFGYSLSSISSFLFLFSSPRMSTPSNSSSSIQLDDWIQENPPLTAVVKADFVAVSRLANVANSPPKYSIYRWFGSPSDQNPFSITTDPRLQQAAAELNAGLEESPEPVAVAFYAMPHDNSKWHHRNASTPSIYGAPEGHENNYMDESTGVSVHVSPAHPLHPGIFIISLRRSFAQMQDSRTTASNILVPRSKHLRNDQAYARIHVSVSSVHNCLNSPLVGIVILSIGYTCLPLDRPHQISLRTPPIFDTILQPLFQ